MSSTPRQYILSEGQSNLCEYGGAFGVMLSLTCLVQHFIVTKTTWVTQMMVPFYFFAILVFLLLAFKKWYAPILLIISSVLSLVVMLTWMEHQATSVVVISLFLYHVIILICLHAEQLPDKLRQRHRAEQQEKDSWVGKI